VEVKMKAKGRVFMVFWNDSKEFDSILIEHFFDDFRFSETVNIDIK